MTDERKTARPPPPLPRRDEDRPKTEAIGRIALRAQKVQALSDQEAFLQALKAHEAAMISEIAAQRHAFEEKIRTEMRALVEHEIRSTPSASPPPIPPAKSEMLAWFPHLPALVVALGALVTSTTQSCGKKAELSGEAVAKITDVSTELKKHVTASDKAFLDQRTLNQSNYNAALDLRDYVGGIFEETLNVKIDDPPGAPRRKEITYYPAPLAPRRSRAPLVQPRVTFPVPPDPKGP